MTGAFFSGSATAVFNGQGTSVPHDGSFRRRLGGARGAGAEKRAPGTMLHSRTIHSGLHGMEFFLDHVDGQDTRDNSKHDLGFELAAVPVGDDGRIDRANVSGHIALLPPYTEPAAGAIGTILYACGKAQPRGRAPPSWAERLSLGQAGRDAARTEEPEGRRAEMRGEIDELARQNGRILAHRRLPHSGGAGLEDAVAEAFRAPGFDDIERMGNREEEDASFGMGGIGAARCSQCAIEAKGSGRGAKIQDILQCGRWAEQRAAAEGSPAKGAFVPNQHRPRPYPESREIRRRIEDNRQDCAERKDTCIIPSCAPYEAVKRALDGEEPDRAEIAGRIANAKGVPTDVL